MTTTLRLPSAVYDQWLDGSAGLLGNFLDQLPPGAPVAFDFQMVSFYVPGALTALLAALHHCHEQNPEITPASVTSAPAFTYLQRIDFSANAGSTCLNRFIDTMPAAAL